ncbi:MAG: hypothetical protein II926_07110 [Bacteroidales bacterium]|nr:hypothetical protein [Bacteroidales bacterium]
MWITKKLRIRHRTYFSNFQGKWFDYTVVVASYDGTNYLHRRVVKLAMQVGF